MHVQTKLCKVADTDGKYEYYEKYSNICWEI